MADKVVSVYIRLFTKMAQHRRNQFRLVPSGPIGWFVGSTEPTVLCALRDAFGVGVRR